METSSQSTVVLSFQDSLIRLSDYNLLFSGCWINDAVIAFAFMYYEVEEFSMYNGMVCYVCPEVTQLIRCTSSDCDLSVILDNLEMSKKNIILFPVNNNEVVDEQGGTHWSLLVYVRYTHAFYHYDSCNYSNSKVASVLCDRLIPLVKDDAACMINTNSPQQTNGYDCGMYVICTANAVSTHYLVNGSWEPTDCMDITPKTVTDKRLQMQSLIKTLAKSSQT